MAYLAKRRVETAAEMLLHGDESMSEIGQTVGWPDQNYFARRFRRFGLSGTTYQERFARTAGQLKTGLEHTQRSAMALHDTAGSSTRS